MEYEHGAVFHGQAVERRSKVQVAIGLYARADHDFAWRSDPAGKEATPAVFESDGFPDDDSV